MTNEIMFANSVTITGIGNEAVFTFKWMAPALDENGRTVGQKIVREQTVTMTRELAHGMINILEQVTAVEASEDGDGKN